MPIPMKAPHALIATAAILLVLAPAARADTVVVNFESGPALETAVTDQYLSAAFVRFLHVASAAADIASFELRLEGTGAVGLRPRKGTRAFRWRLPELAGGRYRLVAKLAVTVGGRGAGTVRRARAASFSTNSSPQPPNPSRR
jgi:hypothetical protein